MKKFVKLKRGDDWGVEYLAINPLNKNGMASSKRRFPIEQDDEFNIRFPDGTTAKHKIIMNAVSTTVLDYSRTYPVAYSLPGIEIVVSGIKTWVCLDQVEIEIDDVTKFK